MSGDEKDDERVNNEEGSGSNNYKWLLMLLMAARDTETNLSKSVIESTDNRKDALNLRIVKEENRIERRGIVYSMEKDKIVLSAINQEITRAFSEIRNNINESYNKTIESNEEKVDTNLRAYALKFKQIRRQKVREVLDDIHKNIISSSDYTNMPYRYRSQADQQIADILKKKKRELKNQMNEAKDEQVARSKQEVREVNQNLIRQRDKELQDTRASERETKETLRNKIIDADEVKANQAKLIELDKIIKSVAEKEEDTSVQFKEINPNVISNNDIESIFGAVSVKPLKPKPVAQQNLARPSVQRQIQHRNSEDLLPVSRPCCCYII
jgi:hypothetical protein